MEYSHFQESHRGFSTPPFNPNFKIPIKSQPPPPGVEIFQSPMIMQDQQQGWAAAFTTATVEHQPAPMYSKGSVKRKPEYLPTEESELPDELKKMFQALHCLLCDAKMNSPISAKMHYESKQHDKKINAWLADWSKKSGLPVPKRQRKVQNNIEGPKGPNAFFCVHCQIPLTSVQHANQHYTGKRHRMVAAGKMCPKGSGYYDNEGKWIKQNKPAIDSSGRYGIGTSFVPQATPPETASLMPPPPPPEIPTTIQAKPAAVTVEDPARYCSVCDIHVTSAQQMETHLAGSKHLKNCKKIGAVAPPPTPLHDEDTLLDSYGSNAPKYTIQDFSIYRTPSGQFYCNVCDLTAQNEGIFSTHISSKKHIKMAKEKR